MILISREIRGTNELHTFINPTILKTIFDNIQLITDKSKSIIIMKIFCILSFEYVWFHNTMIPLLKLLINIYINGLYFL